ncbi:unnamed protein product [Fusarium venenatum]|uniref:Uncharacterized protein n=1 Tax=Fusarium venenatum TaxID=56646 RepID=A0A2L2T4H4_9HYPO|nr:uncharacterized protein FVRRES_01011 [Fusarium venenatum]CEI64499.1 unnamed protein product [Fusarium venenatum]
MDQSQRDNNNLYGDIHWPKTQYPLMQFIFSDCKPAVLLETDDIRIEVLSFVNHKVNGEENCTYLNPKNRTQRPGRILLK